MDRLFSYFLDVLQEGLLVLYSIALVLALLILLHWALDLGFQVPEYSPEQTLY